MDASSPDIHIFPLYELMHTPRALSPIPSHLLASLVVHRTRWLPPFPLYTAQLSPMRRIHNHAAMCIASLIVASNPYDGILDTIHIVGTFSPSMIPCQCISKCAGHGPRHSASLNKKIVVTTDMVLIWPIMKLAWFPSSQLSTHSLIGCASALYTRRVSWACESAWVWFALVWPGW